MPIVIMADENGTEIARGNSSASKRFETITVSDFGMYNCSAQSPNGNAQYMVELRKAGMCMHGRKTILLKLRCLYTQAVEGPFPRGGVLPHIR